MPTIDNEQSIGSNSLRWKNLYATSLYGNLSGNATTATKANIATDRFGIAYYDSTDGKFACTLHGNANTALMGKGNAEPEFVSITPSISITDGTTNDAPKVNLTVLGVSGQTAAAITKATTSLWGVTKLSNTSSTTEEGLAATPKGVWAAIGTLNYTTPATSGTDIAFVTVVDQSAGKIVTSRKTVRDASTLQSGVVSTGTQAFAGDKTFTGVTTFNGNVVMNSAASADALTAGSLIVSGNTNLINTTTTSTILPSAHNTYNIGANGNKYLGIYATMFYGDLSGNAETAYTWATGRTLTIGNTGKTVNGSINVAWSADEILGSSDNSKFYRGDKTWSNTLNGTLVTGGHDLLYGDQLNMTGEGWDGFAFNYRSHSSKTDGQSIRFYNGKQTEIMRLHKNGALSIGSTNSNYKLFVNGTGYFASTVYFGNGTTYYISSDGSNYSGTAAKATILATSRTIWGQSFNGSANISGHLYDAGPNIYLPSGQTTFSFLGSGGSAARGMFGRILLSDNYSNGDLSKYRLDVQGNGRFTDQVYSINYQHGSGARETWYKFATYTHAASYNVVQTLIMLGGGYNNKSFIELHVGSTPNASFALDRFSYKCFYGGIPVGYYTDGNVTSFFLKQPYGGTVAARILIQNYENGGLILVTPVAATETESANIVSITADTSYRNWTINISGNAATATKFNSNQSITLSGDVSGSASSQAGWSITTTIGAGKVTNAMLAGGITKDKITSDVFKIFTRTDVGTSPNFDNPGFNGVFEVRHSSETSGETGTKPVDGFYPMLTAKAEVVMLQLAGSNASGWWIRGKQSGNVTLSGVAWQRIVVADSGTYSINAATATTATNLANTPSLLTSGNTIAVKAGEKTSSYITVPYATNSGTSASCTGNAATATKLNSKGRNNALMNPSANGGTTSATYAPETGLAMYEYYAASSTGAPTNYGNFITIKGNTPGATQIAFPWGGSATNYAPYIRTHSDWSIDHVWSEWKRFWIAGDSVTNAVWNDLAECRKSSLREAGYAITPAGFRATKRLEPGCRITSDTWGFALGDEHDETKMPVAISGRVLAYPARSREEYHLGDCVCSAPDGKVDIMTRQEIRDWPDCIIGIVNEIPDYDEWGSDEKDNTGRNKIKINGRIWIDIK